MRRWLLHFFLHASRVEKENQDRHRQQSSHRPRLAGMKTSRPSKRSSGAGMQTTSQLED